MALVLSVDVGTTNLKVGVVNEKGEILSHASAPLTTERPIRRAAEHCPVKLWNAFVRTCREASEGYRPEIKIITVSCYQFGMLFLNEKFEPCSGMTTLLDTRARLTHDHFLEQVDPYALYQRTGCPPFFQYPLSRLFYLREKEPEQFKDAKYFASAKAYLLLKLAGEFVTDPSTDSASQLMNIHNLDWDQESLNHVGIDAGQCPRIVEAAAEEYTLTKEAADALNLSTDVKVIPGVYDGGALALGMGQLAQRVAILNVGTTGFIRVTSPEPIFDKDERMRFQVYYLADGLYFIGGGINNAGLPLRWCKENLFAEDYEELLPLAANSTIGSRKLFFLPYLTGERDWRIGNVASGTFFGLREYHKKGDVVRSILEGVAYCLRLIKDSMEDNDLAIDSIMIGGGGTKHQQWVDIFGAVLALPMTLTPCLEPCLLGNAVLGFTQIGEFKDRLEAADRLLPSGRTFEAPKDQVDDYVRFFEFYSELYEGLGDLYRKHAEFAV